MIKANRQLIIASRNPHKIDEIRAIAGPKFAVRGVADFDRLPEVAETGSTFLENATLKAVAISKEVSGLVISDDSGLEVDALDGAPGVGSSSYGGEEGNQARNRARLLKELGLRNDRRARFRCVMVIAQDGEVLADFSGAVEGRVLENEQGDGGFGYDSLFAPEGNPMSFAELPSGVKNSMSHRGRALSQVMRWLEQQSRADK